MPSQRDIEFNVEIDRLSKNAKLDSWNSFVEELQVPGDIAPALYTMRPEMLKLVQPRQLSQLEHQTYLNLIAGLIQTNIALRQHTEETARLVGNWVGQVNGIIPLASRIQHFANFRRLGEFDDDQTH